MMTREEFESRTWCLGARDAGAIYDLVGSLRKELRQDRPPDAHAIDVLGQRAWEGQMLKGQAGAWEAVCRRICEHGLDDIVKHNDTGLGIALAVVDECARLLKQPDPHDPGDEHRPRYDPAKVEALLDAVSAYHDQQCQWGRVSTAYRALRAPAPQPADGWQSRCFKGESDNGTHYIRCDEAGKKYGMFLAQSGKWVCINWTNGPDCVYFPSREAALTALASAPPPPGVTQ